MNYLYFSNYLSLGILAYLGNGFLTLKENDKYHNILIFQICCVLFVLVDNCFHSTHLFNAIIIYSIFLISLFHSKKQNYIFVLCLYLLISFTSSFLIRSLFGYFSSNTLLIVETSLSYLVICILSNFIDLLICKIYIKIKKIFQYFEISYTLILTFVYPLIILIIISLIYNNYLVVTNETILNILCSILLFSNLVIFWFFYKTIKEIELNSKLNNSLEKEKYLRNKYDLLHQNYQNNFTFLHSILHFCKQLTIQKENLEFDNLKETIDELADATYKELELIHTNFLVLNILLSNKYEEIHENKISVHTAILYNEFSFMKTTDLMELFSLLLDHAIESCKLTEWDKRIMNIKTIKKGNQIMIQFLFPNQMYMLI